MKTKTWIILIAILLVLSIGAALLLYNNKEAAAVQVWSEGKLLYTLPLDLDTTVTVQTKAGTNTVTVKDGKVAVTDADCPDQYCMKRGFCSGGMQIVCLPNRLVLKFSEKTALDGVTG